MHQSYCWPELLLARAIVGQSIVGQSYCSKAIVGQSYCWPASLPGQKVAREVSLNTLSGATPRCLHQSIH